MRLQQVIPGAANKKEHTISFGRSATGFPYIAYGKAFSIVILNGNDLSVLQCIPPPENSTQTITCLQWCDKSSDLAVARGTHLMVYSLDVKPWTLVTEFHFDSVINCLNWSRDGKRLAIGSSNIIIYERNDSNVWKQVWNKRLASPVYHLAYSPDSRLLASAGKNDRVVKVWWQQEEISKNNSKQILKNRWSFVYLPHARAVTKLMWREFGPYHRRFDSVNILMTSCVDGVSRIWSGIEGCRPDLLHFYLAALINPSNSLILPLQVSDVTIVSKEKAKKMEQSRDKHISVAWIPSKELWLSLHRRDKEGQINLMKDDTVKGGTFAHKESGDNIKNSPQAVNPPDLAFTILNDGTLAVWKIEGIDSKPRCIPRVQIVTRLAHAFPIADAETITHIVSVYCSERKQLAGKRCEVHNTSQCACKPAEVSIICRHSSGMFSKWRIGLQDMATQCFVSYVEYDSRCSGHGTGISSLKSHAELPFLLSMGKEKFRGKGEMLIWNVDAVRFMEGLFSPLTSLARVKSPTYWDPATMSWFANRGSFLAVTEDQLVLFSIHLDNKDGNESRYASVKKQAEIKEAAPYAKDLLSIHVYAIVNDESATATAIPTSESHPGLSRTNSKAKKEKNKRHYVIGLLKDGITMLVWQMDVSQNGTFNFAKLVDGPKRLDLPEGVSITYLTRPFSVRLQHITSSSSLTIGTSTSSDDHLFCVSGCSDGIIRFWQCNVSLDGTLCTWECVKKSEIIIGDSVKSGVGGSRPRTLIAKPESLNRVACLYRGDDEVQREIFILESFTGGGKEMNIEDIISFPEGTRIFGFEWMNCGDGGSTLLAIGAGNHIYIYTQCVLDSYKESQCKWVLIHQFKLVDDDHFLSDPPIAFVWTSGGSLVVACVRRMLVFSKWLDEPVVISSEDGTIQRTCGSVFELSSAKERSLPQYHPKHLTYLLMNNLNSRFEEILKKLGKEISKSITIAEMQSTYSKPVEPTLEHIPFLPPHSWPSEEKEVTQKRGSIFNMDTRSFMMANNGNNHDVSIDWLKDNINKVQIPCLNKDEICKLNGIISYKVLLKSVSNALDDNGKKALCSIYNHFYVKKHCENLQLKPELTSLNIFWAYHCSCQETLLEVLINNNIIEVNWEDFEEIRSPLWLSNLSVFQNYIEKIARDSFQKDKDPLKCAIWYIALKKKKVLAGLFRIVNDDRMFNFFSNDFTEDRWQTAALKNAYALMGKQRFNEAAAFFLLGDSLKDAVSVCLQHGNNFYMALAICRLYEGGENGPEYQKLITTTFYEFATEEKDVPLKSLLLWKQKKYMESIDMLLEGNATDSKNTNLNEEIDKNETAPYHPLVASAVSYLKTTTALREKQIKRESEIKQLCKAFYAYRHVGLSIVAMDVLQTIFAKNKAILNNKESSKTLMANSSSSISGVPAGMGGASGGAKSFGGLLGPPPRSASPAEDPMASGMLDMGAFGFDDSDESDEEDPMAMIAAEMDVTPEVAVEAQIDEGKGSEHSDIIFDIWWSSDQRNVTLSIMRDIVEHIPKRTCLWNKIRDYISNDLKAIEKIFHIANLSCPESESEIIDALICCYHLHGDLQKEVLLLGSIDNLTAIYQSMMTAATNLVLGVPHATYLFASPQYGVNTIKEKTPLSTTAVAKTAKITATGLPMTSNSGAFSPLLSGSLSASASQSPFASHPPSSASSPTPQRPTSGVSPESTTTSSSGNTFLIASADPYLLQQFRTTALDLSNCLQQCLMNHEMAHETKLSSLTFKCEMFVVIYVALFVNSWWDENLSLMQTLLINTPECKTFSQFIDVFEASLGHLDVPDTQSIMERVSQNLNRRHSADDVIDKSNGMAELFLTSVDFNDNEDDDDLDLLSVDSNDRESILTNIFKVKPNQAKIEADKKRIDYCFAVLKLACIQYITISVQRFLADMEFSFSDLIHKSPLLYTALSTLEAWSLQAELFVQEMESPTNVLDLQDHVYENIISFEHEDRPAHGLTLLLDHNNNPYRTSSKTLRRLWYFIIRQESVYNIMIRFLFHEKVPCEQEENKTHVTLVNDIESVHSFCINHVDGGTIAYTTLKETKETSLREITEEEKDEDLSTIPVQGLQSNSAISFKVLDANTSAAFSPLPSRSKDRGESLTSDDEWDYRLTPAHSPLVLKKASNSNTDLPSFNIHTPTMSRSSSQTLRLDDKEMVLSAKMASTTPVPSTSPVDPNLAKKGKRPGSSIQVLEAHPNMPFYLSGSVDGKVKLWLFEQEDIQFEYQSKTSHPITSLRFDMFGNKFGATDSDGNLSLWRFGADDSAALPFKQFKCHKRGASDFAFLNSASFIATAGSSDDSRNICLYDTLVAEDRSLVKAFKCHPHGGAMSVVHASGRQLLISGGKRGTICMFDLRQRRLMHQFPADEGSIMSVAIDAAEKCLVTGSSNGIVKIWNLSTNEEIASFPAHSRPTNFLNSTKFLNKSYDLNGVLEVKFVDDFLYSSGADGTVKRWWLP